MPTHLRVYCVSICPYNLGMSDLTADAGGQDTPEQRLSTLLQVQPGLCAQGCPTLESAPALVQSASMKRPLPVGLRWAVTLLVWCRAAPYSAGSYSQLWPTLESPGILVRVTVAVVKHCD